MSLNHPLKLVVAVSGSIYATQVPAYLIKITRDLTNDVHVIMTHAARRVIPEATIEQYCPGQVHSDGWSQGPDGRPIHVSLAYCADVALVLPATANTVGKLANGIADNMVLTCLLAMPPSIVILAPCMNQSMWVHPAVARNVARLRADGYQVIIPVHGDAVGGPVGSNDGMTPTLGAVLEAVKSRGGRREKVASRHGRP